MRPATWALGGPDFPASLFRIPRKIVGGVLPPVSTEDSEAIGCRVSCYGCTGDSSASSSSSTQTSHDNRTVSMMLQRCESGDG